MNWNWQKQKFAPLENLFGELSPLFGLTPEIDGGVCSELNVVQLLDRSLVMPSFFGKTHLYRYDIQGGAKSHYLVFVHLPSLSTHLKHLYSHLSLAADDSLPSTFECLMSSASCPKDCLEYLFQRLQIRDRNVFHCFALSYFNSAQQQSIWLDPDQPMKEQLVKGGEAKASLTLTYLLYPPTPHEIRDENARKILYQQLFCNFLSGIFPISGTLVAHFLRGERTEKAAGGRASV